MKDNHLVCIIIKAEIDSSNIWGRCPFPHKELPHGFEFCFPSIIVSTIEECEIPEDNGLILCSPDKNNGIVLIRSMETEEEQYGFSEISQWFQVSHW